MVKVRKQIKAVKKKRPTKKITKERSTKSRGVLDRIGPIGFGDEGVSINMYGKSGTGKTTLWGSFPSPILAIICSGSKRPGELRSLNTPANRKRIKQVVLESPEEIQELVDYQSANSEFKTIVLDHASGLQEMVLAGILGVQEIPPQGSWGMASREEWGQCALQTKTLLRLFLGLECNRVVVAQEREFNTDGDDDNILEPYVASALSPSVTGWLNPACDYIVQTFKRPKMTTKKMWMGKGKKRKQVERKIRGTGVDYCLRVGPHSVFTTKFRLPKGTELPEVLVDPDYTKIMKLIEGG